MLCQFPALYIPWSNTGCFPTPVDGHQSIDSDIYIYTRITIHFGIQNVGRTTIKPILCFDHDIYVTQDAGTCRNNASGLATSLARVTVDDGYFTKQFSFGELLESIHALLAPQ